MKTIKKLLMVPGIIIVSIIGFYANAQEVKTIPGTPLKLTYYNSAESTFGVTSVLVTGKQDAILIDAQFTLPDAEKVAAMIKSSGKKLKAIFISYGDPDYYFGLEAIRKYYPNTPVYATEPTIEHIKATYKGKLEYWGKILKQAAPKQVIVPSVFNGNFMELDGNKLEIVKVPGAPVRSFVWIPAVKAVVGGINVFGNDFHLWMADDATAEKRALWVDALNKVISLNPKVVIPGHFGNKADLTIASVNYTKTYLQTYEQLLKTNKSSKSMIAALKVKYPKAGFLTGLELGAKVNTGEMQWK
ncbi:MBL fold metallo-hydrolase [Mucilaginibacter lappiensis]|uniref:Glyoxylase-like metal-dependent hydrolase (Beta-lactamase superfamily II) n=1 Tax=Mucilaginibacter lappiensis TaxID=354630 RepID=A0A841JGH6_9SPHI|nr:MBL fold metallo-hydrolase [Mucilaginibacter lappiensis]MBB6127141.1 glyoxylase-like metal-dependent hydrolase (beta-lactamase superfamily II) [Mucilaginibacter lappiensis]